MQKIGLNQPRRGLDVVLWKWSAATPDSVGVSCRSSRERRSRPFEAGSRFNPNVRQTASYLSGSKTVIEALQSFWERSAAAFAVETSTILSQAVSTQSARLALDGGSGTVAVPDYRGVEVLSSYGPLHIAGLDWAILAEVDMAEITAPAAGVLQSGKESER